MDAYFDNFSDFIARAADKSTPRKIQTAFAIGDYYTNWTGTGTIDDAVKLAREGWEEGRNEIERRRADFEKLVGHKTTRLALCHNPAGFTPDVPAFLNADPESMFSCQSVDAESPGRIIRVVVSSAYRVNITTKTVIARGALICALIDEMEARGMRCELTTVFTSRADNGLVNRLSVALKRADEPLEIDRAAFALAHASMFRRLVFSVRETDLLYMSAGDHGSSYDDSNFVENDLFIPTLNENLSDGEQLHYLKRRLAPLGITFDE